MNVRFCSRFIVLLLHLVIKTNPFKYEAFLLEKKNQINNCHRNLQTIYLKMIKKLFFTNIIRPKQYKKFTEVICQFGHKSAFYVFADCKRFT